MAFSDTDTLTKVLAEAFCRKRADEMTSGECEARLSIILRGCRANGISDEIAQLWIKSGLPINEIGIKMKYLHKLENDDEKRREALQDLEARVEAANPKKGRRKIRTEEL